MEKGINIFKVDKMPIIIDILSQNHKDYFLDVFIIQTNNKVEKIISVEKIEHSGWVSYLINKNDDGKLYIEDSLGNNSTLKVDLNSVYKVKIWGTEYFVNCNTTG